MTVRCVSYGGGVQSTALLVLAVQQRIDFDLFLFANTGDDSENPATLDYVRTVAAPYAASHGIELVELRHPTDTLLGQALGPNRRFPLPMFGEGGMPLRRACTGDFKIKVIRRELRRRGATSNDPAVVGLGISVDEIERAGPSVDPHNRGQHRVYPLLELMLHRTDCRRVIADGGLPVPSKSACWFCPFHDREAWRRQKRDEPELFARSCALETAYQTKLANAGKRSQYLTRHGRPLIEVIDDQGQLDGMAGECDSGWCMT